MHLQISDAVREIDPLEAFATLDVYRVVDVREVGEFHGPLGSIKGAELLGRPPIMEQCESFCASASLLLVCRLGQRSADACSYLQQNGASNVTSLRGGMIAWNLKGLPVVRTKLSTLAKLEASIVAWVGLVTASSSREAQAEVDNLLREAGVSVGKPTAAALHYTLDKLSHRFPRTQAPLDLELVINAFRRDLAVL